MKQPSFNPPASNPSKQTPKAAPAGASATPASATGTQATTATAGHQTQVPVGATVTTKTKVTAAKAPRVRKSGVRKQPTPPGQSGNGQLKKYAWWILWILLALLLAWLAYKYLPMLTNKSDSGKTYTQTPVGNSMKVESTTNGIPTMVMTNSGAGPNQQAINVGNGTIIQNGCCHGLQQSITPAPVVQPTVKRFPLDFVPDFEGTINPSKGGVMVRIPAGKYFKYYFPVPSDWEVYPETWASQGSFKIEINGQPFTGTITGIRSYGFLNEGSMDMEVFFQFKKKPGWCARLFGRR